MTRQLKPTVITVHGINSDGQWQAEVRRALEPHFGCQEVRYGEYRNLGFLALVLEPRSLLALLVVTYALAFTGVLQGPLVFILPGLFLLVAFHLASRQRRSLLERFKRDLARIEENQGHQGPPHIIAHCFGTYLAGWALRAPSLRFDHVILVGAVLPTDYDWARLFQGGQRAFRRLRNEVGCGDWALWASVLSFPFCPDLGWAGWRGFRPGTGSSPIPVAVHDAIDPYGTCKTCQWPTEPSIHNVRLAEITRREQFIQFPHARTFWRPFLWEIDPLEYQDFLELCSGAARVAAQAEQMDQEDPELRRLEPELRRLEQVLGETHWRFLGRTVNGGRSLNEVIRELVPGVTPERLADGLSLIWNLVAFAQKEEAKSPIESRDEQILLALKPEVAIQKAVIVLTSDGA